MSSEDNSNEKNKSILSRAYDKAARNIDGAAKGISSAIKGLGKDVANDTHQLKDEFIKYGKNRIASGTALAIKGGFIGTLIPIPGIGTKAGIVIGFTAGFFGGKPVATKLEKWLEKKEAEQLTSPANENSPPAQSDPDNEAEQSADDNKPPEPRL